jgi:hypothetical protein
MATYTLDSTKTESPEFAFEGVKSLAIDGGQGDLYLLRSVAGSPFLPYGEFKCDGTCAFNGILEERGHSSKYKFKADLTSGEVNIYLSRGVR